MSCRMSIFALLTVSTIVAQEATVPGWTLNGVRVSHDSARLDYEIFHGGRASATIKAREAHALDLATLTQSISAHLFLGRRVRLTAWVKAQKAHSVYLWMRVEGTDLQLAYDEMSNRRKHGTFDWKKMEIVLDVLPPAETIHYGLVLSGGGQAWIDDVVVEPVEGTVKSTNMLWEPTSYMSGSIAYRGASIHSRPFNLDFEYVPD
jgi:hypothetical protein